MHQDELRDIPDFPGYSATCDGRIMGKYKKWLTPWSGKYGHLCVMLYKDGRQVGVGVHRAVLMAWIGPCPSRMDGCHNDSKPGHNHLFLVDGCQLCHFDIVDGCDICKNQGPGHGNLRWDTRKGNKRDSIIAGTAKIPRYDIGQQHPNCKLDDDKVREIKKLLSEGSYTQRQIADMYNVTNSLISMINTKRVWGHIK